MRAIPESRRMMRREIVFDSRIFARRQVEIVRQKKPELPSRVRKEIGGVIQKCDAGKTHQDGVDFGPPLEVMLRYQDGNENIEAHVCTDIEFDALTYVIGRLCEICIDRGRRSRDDLPVTLRQLC